MQRFKWTKAHAVFIPEVDAEHRNLFHMAGELEAAVLANGDETRVQEALRALMAAVEDHFSYEERRMRSARYSSYAWHKQQHDTLRKRAGWFVPRVESGDRESALLLLEFLSGWLKDHTALADRMMGAYLRNYERQAARAAVPA
ncbi:MAG: hemerythrin family protein [Acidobacteriia bacterium]|nr:hemerythrin family protein [Terriglobia bacterium]